MAYPYLNGTMAGDNIMYIFVYANDVTHDLFGRFMVISFFLIVLLASSVLQYKFTARIRFETSLLASSFATLGFATIIEQFTGIFNSFDFFILLGVTVLSFMWVAKSSGE